MSCNKMSLTKNVQLFSTSDKMSHMLLKLFWNTVRNLDYFATQNLNFQELPPRAPAGVLGACGPQIPRFWPQL